TWHLVKDTPRVMGFIGGTASPVTAKLRIGPDNTTQVAAGG
ncbi:hypothetical protein PSYJA_43039, partial [Pseudomonas syringae pv. japonica str. M301072]